MVAESTAPQPWRLLPQAGRSTLNRQAQRRGRTQGSAPLPPIDRVIGRVHANGMRVPVTEESGPRFVIASSQPRHCVDPEETEYPVVRFAAVLFAEQAEKQEYIARADSLIVQMRLRGTALTEQAGTIGQEHRVVMAEIVTAQLAATGTGNMFGKAKFGIGRE